MREFIHFYLNGKEIKVSGEDAFLPLSVYLRDSLYLTGTKVVCAEGDCGACSVLKYAPNLEGEAEFKAINSCINFVYNMDGAILVTVEALKSHPITKALVDHYGSQCGFCTPGIVVALVSLFEKKTNVESYQVKNALTGNLCRCTGYQAIIDSALSVKGDLRNQLEKEFCPPEWMTNLKESGLTSIGIEVKDKSLFQPKTFQEAINFKSDQEESDIVGQATDLGVLHNKRRKISTKVLSLTSVSELYKIENTNDYLIFGSKVGLERCRRALKNDWPEFSEFLNIFASPQIKNVGTLVGNIANASPIGDSIPFLWALGATLLIESKNQGAREVKIQDFFLGGYKEIDLKKDELIKGIKIPKRDQFKNQLFIKIYKASKRRDLDISSVNACIWSETEVNGTIKNIRFVFGGVGPSVMELIELNNLFLGKKPTKAAFQAARELLPKLITPISDARASKEYRLKVAQNFVREFGLELLGEKL